MRRSKKGKGRVEVQCHHRKMALRGINLNFCSPSKKVLFFLLFCLFYVLWRTSGCFFYDVLAFFVHKDMIHLSKPLITSIIRNFPSFIGWLTRGSHFAVPLQECPADIKPELKTGASRGPEDHGGCRGDAGSPHAKSVGFWWRRPEGDLGADDRWAPQISPSRQVLGEKKTIVQRK